METLKEIASQFVDGPLWVEVSGSGEETVESLDDASMASFDRIAVLVNEGTASAAELLAGLLKESNDAVLVGSTTFGKSAIQGLVPLTDGSMLRLTVAEWRTPGGITVADGGIEPDRVALTEESQLEAALAAAHQVSRGG
jgi:carboxyl-terminal processing protease